MSVNLQKGQKVDLTKGKSGVKNLRIGLGWDAAEPKAGGIFGAFKPAPKNIDCDASVLACGADGKLPSRNDIVYFGRLNHSSGAIIHMGDNLTGDGDGDDEQIELSLEQLPTEYERLVVVVNIYQAQSRNQHFGMINNAYIRIVNADNGEEMCRYNLSENYDNMTAMIFGEVYKHGGEWKFNAIGQPTQDASITELSKRYL